VGEILQAVGLVSFPLLTQLKGLYGYYDGNSANDFLFPNQTTLSLPASDQEYFSFGESWRVAEQESLFEYFGSTNYSTINDPAFQPIFRSAVGPASSKALASCSHLQTSSQQLYDACLMDVTVTDDANFAVGADVVLQEKNRITQLVNVTYPPQFTFPPTTTPAGESSSTMEPPKSVGDTLVVSKQLGLILLFLATFLNI